MTLLGLPPPRWLPPAERKDMYDRTMKELWEDWQKVPPPQPTPVHTTDAERDEADTEKICATLGWMAQNERDLNAAAAVHARVILGRCPRPRLQSVAKRAGRIGADRFRGRYVPHLIWNAERCT
jgi:hypothetical protein